MNVRACLITNPRSGRGGIDLAPVLPVLKAHGWEVEVRHKLKGGMATELAAQAAQEGFDVVVNCGGDGTLNEIINGLTGTDVAVGCIPGGTVNLWSKELGISSDLAVAALQLVGARRRKVDVGQLSTGNKKGQCFLLMAGLGFDGAVISRVSKPLKNRIGKLEVGLAGIQALASFKPGFVQVEMDEISWQGHTGQIVIGNTRQYGGFTSFTPQAYIDDGLLDICILPETNPVGFSRQIFDLLVKKQPDLKDSQIYRAASIKISSSVPLKIQLDGGKFESAEKLSAKGSEYHFSIIPQGVNVLVPSAYDNKLFQGHGEQGQGQGQGQEQPDTPVPTLKVKIASGTNFNNSALVEKKKVKSEKEKKIKIRILEAGIDYLIGLNLKKGNSLVTVFINEQTVLKKKGPGTRRKGTAAIMVALKEGDYIKVRGLKTSEKSKILAKRISLIPPPN